MQTRTICDEDKKHTEWGFLEAAPNRKKKQPTKAPEPVEEPPPPPKKKKAPKQQLVEVEEEDSDEDEYPYPKVSQLEKPKKKSHGSEHVHGSEEMAPSPPPPKKKGKKQKEISNTRLIELLKKKLDDNDSVEKIKGELLAARKRNKELEEQNKINSFVMRAHSERLYSEYCFHFDVIWLAAFKRSWPTDR